MLNFQGLDVYRCAIEFLALSSRLPLPRGQTELRDQLRRASLSIPLNIAEGAGRTTVPDAARHYAIARGSAMECAALLDALQVLGALEPALHTSASELLGRLVAMLSKLARPSASQT